MHSRTERWNHIDVKGVFVDVRVRLLGVLAGHILLHLLRSKGRSSSDSMVCYTRSTLPNLLNVLLLDLKIGLLELAQNLRLRVDKIDHRLLEDSV